MTKAATAAFSAPRGSDLMQLLIRRSWRKQQPTVHATWRLMDIGQVRMQQDAEITHRGRGPYQGPTDTQLTGVKMDTPYAGCAPQEVRLLGVEPQSVGTHPYGDLLNTKLHMTPLLWY